MTPTATPTKTQFDTAAQRMQETAQDAHHAARNLQQQARDLGVEPELQQQIDLVAEIGGSLVRCANAVAVSTIGADIRHRFNALYRTLHKQHYTVGNVEEAIGNDHELSSATAQLRVCLDNAHIARRNLKAAVQPE